MYSVLEEVKRFRLAWLFWFVIVKLLLGCLIIVVFGSGVFVELVSVRVWVCSVGIVSRYK